MRILIYTTILATIISFLIGCKAKTVFVPVESVKTEYRDKYVRDSIHIKDSVIIDRNGDTIRIKEFKYIYIDKLVRDTINKTDSINVPYPVVEYIEVNKLREWQIILMILGGVLLGYIVFKIVRLFKK